MKLYCIEKYEGLRGKTIKDTCIIGFRDLKDIQAILTTDGGIYAAKFYPRYGDDDDCEEFPTGLTINDMGRWEIEHQIANNGSLRGFLHAMGASYDDMDDFAIKQIEVRKQKEAVEREGYRKKKYEEAKKLVTEYEGADE